jgi:hypothetical protein
MAKLLSIIKLCLDLGAIALDLLKAAVRMYNEYLAQLEDVTQESILV